MRQETFRSPVPLYVEPNARVRHGPSGTEHGVCHLISARLQVKWNVLKSLLARFPFHFVDFNCGFLFLLRFDYRDRTLLSEDVAVMSFMHLHECIRSVICKLFINLGTILDGQFGSKGEIAVKSFCQGHKLKH